MNEKIKNTKYTFTFEDGDTCEMTLAFYLLYQLKGINKALYDRYNKVMTKGLSEEIDSLLVLYTAYVLANIENVEDCMTEKNFIIKCGSSRTAVRNAVSALTDPKKK